MDGISKMNKEALIMQTGENAYTIASNILNDEYSTLSCMKWYLRGLALSDAIRKVLVDAEMRENMQNNFLLTIH